MAEKETKKTEEEREDARNSQLSILRDEGLKQFAVALSGRNESQFGQIGKISTYLDSKKVIENPSEIVSKRLSDILFPYVKPEEMYEGSMTPIELLRTMTSFYFGGLNLVKVSDVIELMGSKVSDEVLSSDKKSMYMGDFAEVDKESYEKIMGLYQNYVATVGVGESIVRYGKTQAGSLEGILSQREEN